MSKEKIEITLNYVDGEYVDLNNMSIKALESFLSVTNSLKNIAESISQEITFTIKKGSAYTAVNGSSFEIGNIYNTIDEAISGESIDDNITSNLRNIQKELQNEVFKYQFKYADINLDERIRSAKKITKKRTRGTYQTELTVLSGFFNSIGGNDPNYHFDYGAGQKTIIDCTIKDVDELKDYLYKTISCLVIKKFQLEDTEKITYYHCSILQDNQVKYFREFSNRLNKANDLFERLELIYDFTDNSNSLIEDLSILLKSYHLFFSDINELKTLLIITKSLKDNPKIKNYRKSLLENFEHTVNKI
ncbi:hypothetical protein [Patiriisocius marinus]|uniref:hypothetical protein n=1 Tax=Patiriisocius marinus TaxID=1397112 RepID=UPI00232F2253|nr:hypothetical protein [Patiriisocius marinus]